MNERPQFSLSRSGRKRKSISSDFELLFNAISNPSFVIEPRTYQILQANQSALDLIGYPLVEILGLDIRTLVINWPEGLLVLDENHVFKSSHATLKFSRRNQAAIDLKLIGVSHLQARDEVVLTFDTTPLDTYLTKIIAQGQLWKYLIQGVNAVSRENLEQSIQEILQVGCLLSGASMASAYRANNQEPEFIQMAAFGDTDWLPKIITLLDLKTLRAPRIWQRGKRAYSAFDHFAQENEVSYMASVPIGQPNAIIGLLVQADRLADPPATLLQISSIIAALINITIQKQSLQSENAWKNLEVVEYRLREEILLNHINEGVVILNPDLTIRDLNPAAEVMLGYGKPEAQGYPVQDVFADADFLFDFLNGIINGSPNIETGEFHLYRRSGQSFMANIHAFPLVREQKPNEVIMLVNDLSEQEAIRNQTRQLEERAILGELAAVFSHEVRNPVNNISTGLELLALNLGTEEPNYSTITRLQNDCDRLAELTKSILAYSRTAEYSMAPINLVQLLRNQLDRMQLQIERAKVHADLHVESNCLLVLGNARALEQVFNNLISNALQAMGEKGGQLILKVKTIDPPPILTQEKRKSLEISVIDTGPGIPKELQERIFLPYFTTNQGGTGLGLAITKRIITAHKGTISLESFPGGTVFHIVLPAYE